MRLRQVTGPTIPSAPMPAWLWNDTTAERVAGPNTPSTASDSLRFLFNCACRARTAGPVEPCWTVTTSVFQVLGPTMPSTARPRRLWKVFTADSVAGPNTPSAVTEMPWACSRYCTASVSTPRLPRLWVWKNALAYALAGTVTPPSVRTNAASTTMAGIRVDRMAWLLCFVGGRGGPGPPRPSVVAGSDPLDSAARGGPGPAGPDVDVGVVVVAGVAGAEDAVEARVAGPLRDRAQRRRADQVDGPAVGVLPGSGSADAPVARLTAAARADDQRTGAGLPTQGFGLPHHPDQVRPHLGGADAAAGEAGLAAAGGRLRHLREGEVDRGAVVVLQCVDLAEGL